MIVVDASVVVAAITDQGRVGGVARRHLEGRSATASAPHTLDVEVLSALRGLVRGNVVSLLQAARALRQLEGMPVTRYGATTLLRRMWALRDNLSTYDASYIALAELLRCPVITLDQRLARAPGVRCPVEVIA